MTRASLRILNRARSDAWRRVGIPMTWEKPAEQEEGGKNVTGETPSNAGTGRTEPKPPNVSSDKDER